MTQQATAAEFTAQLGALRKSGLNKSLIQQFGEAGVGTPGANVTALSGASASQIATTNALHGQVGKAADAAGNQVAGSLYQSGIDSAVGYINGLKSKEKQVQQAASALAALVAGQVKNDLGIHSPSTVMAGFGVNSVDRFTGGWHSRLGTVKAASLALRNAAATHVQPGADAQPARSFGLEHAGPVDVRLSSRDIDAIALKISSLPVHGRLTADSRGITAQISQDAARRVRI